MKNFLVFSGISLYIIIGYLYWDNIFHTVLNVLVYIFAFIGLISIIFFLIKYEFFINLIRNLFLGEGLINSIENILNEFPSPTIQTISTFIGHLILRITRINIVTLLISILPILLLIQQNRLLNYQNKLFIKQNEQIINQNQLVDAQRKNSLMFVFGNIITMINEDMKSNNLSRKLSDQTISSIISLSKGLKPYRQLEDTILSELPLSLERGQLLLLLVTSNINKLSLDKIYEKADFSFSDLRNSNLEGAYLRNCKLNNSELHYSQLKLVDFRGANLNNVCFRGSNIGSTNFKHANLANAKFDNAIFSTETKLDSAKTNSKNWFDSITMNTYDLNLYFNEMLDKYGIDTIKITSFGENTILESGYRILSINNKSEINTIKKNTKRSIFNKQEIKIMRENILKDSSLFKAIIKD